MSSFILIRQPVFSLKNCKGSEFFKKFLTIQKYLYSSPWPTGHLCRWTQLLTPVKRDLFSSEFFFLTCSFWLGEQQDRTHCSWIVSPVKTRYKICQLFFLLLLPLAVYVLAADSRINYRNNASRLLGERKKEKSKHAIHEIKIVRFKGAPVKYPVSFPKGWPKVCSSIELSKPSPLLKDK